MSKNTQGYIYVFKLIVGTCNDFIKIGKSGNIDNEKDRLVQHKRTSYHGFTPYCDFVTGKIIATKFEVKNMNKCDKAIKEIKKLKNKQLSNLEVYNIDYDIANKLIYEYLVNENELIKFVEDGYSVYPFIKESTSIKSITKKDYNKVKDDLINKYKKNLPEELLEILREKDEFIKHCKSHYDRKNYIDFPNDLVLDTNFNAETRIKLYNDLLNILNS